MNTDDATRAAVLDAAGRMFFRTGAAGFTMDRLAAELRMSKKTVYRYFPSRSALLLALLETVGERMDRDTRAVVEDTEADPATKLERLVRVFGRHLSVLGPPQVEAFRRDPVLWERATRMRAERILGPVRQVLEEGTERGQVRSEVRPEIATHFVPILIERLAQSDAVVESTASVGEVLEQLGLILARGLFRPPGREGER